MTTSDHSEGRRISRVLTASKSEVEGCAIGEEWGSRVRVERGGNTEQTVGHRRDQGGKKGNSGP